MKSVQFSGDISGYHAQILDKLMHRQSEVRGTTRFRRPFVREEILHPLLEALDKECGGDFEKLGDRLSVIIREALSNHLTLDNSKAIGGSLKAATV